MITGSVLDNSGTPNDYHQRVVLYGDHGQVNEYRCHQGLFSCRKQTDKGQK